MPMYNLLGYSSNYPDTTNSLEFYFKDESSTFNADIVCNNKTSESFGDNSKFLKQTFADGLTKIPKNATIAVSLK